MEIIIKKLVRHDRVYYKPGTPVVMEDSAAERLIALNAAEAKYPTGSKGKVTISIPGLPNFSGSDIQVDKGIGTLGAESIVASDNSTDTDVLKNQAIDELVQVHGITDSIANILVSAGIMSIESLKTTSKTTLKDLIKVNAKAAEEILADANTFVTTEE